MLCHVCVLVCVCVLCITSFLCDQVLLINYRLLWPPLMRYMHNQVACYVVCVTVLKCLVLIHSVVLIFLLLIMQFGDNGHVLKVLKQMLCFDGITYVLQEIYGLENKSKQEEQNNVSVVYSMCLLQ